MGLDMYLEGRKYLWGNWHNPENDPHEDGFKLKGKTLELGYWRKHPNLHGYIVREFADGKDECQDIELGQEDLVKLIAAVKAGDLPNTTGFFFGRSMMDDEERREDLAILAKALLWLQDKENGVSRSVVYRASW